MTATSAHDPRPEISIVIPVRDEAGNAAPLVDEIVRSLAGRSYEIIYVNDGSSDGTENELLQLMKTIPCLRQIKHSYSCGKSAALTTGITAARAEMIVMLDGDGQNNPIFIPALVDKLKSASNIGLVAAQRVGRKTSAFKRLQSRIANRVRGMILHDGTRDTGCGFKAVRRDVFLQLPLFDGLHRFLPALVRREGHDIAYVDVIDRERLHGESKYGFWDRLWVGILDLFGVWWLIRRRERIAQVLEISRDAH